MNYRHAFHAGNHADILKHVALILCLAAMQRNEKPLAVLDTHAGIGVYDLTGDAASRSPEWRGGFARLQGWAEAPEPVLRLVAMAAAFGEGRYPGSPAIVAAMLRAQDRLMACELHPEDAQTLKAWAAGDGRIQVHRRDGFAATSALLPPPERRGLVLVDPPYEAPDEVERSVGALKAGVKRFAHGVYLWWRPLKRPGFLDAADAELAAIERPVLRADLAVASPTEGAGLVASSILIVNPPFGVAESLAATLPTLAARLALGPGAGARIR
jgi:23S rRNA (adenine2030-N6)-methyltransferase